jgi:DNA polymerase I-like protein with 3'-5' exonuclease and polymerase domains
METVLDIETTVSEFNGGKSPSPYLKDNKIVSVQYGDANSRHDEEFYPFYHDEAYEGDAALGTKKVQEVLNKTKLLIGHNLKFDLCWLRECGFTYDGPVWDTMIFEYVCAKGLKPGLKLSDCATRHNITAKKDTLGNYLKEGKNVNEIPMDELADYAMGDIHTTRELYQRQRQMLKDREDVQFMSKAINLMNEFLPILVDFERKGISIDMEELLRLEDEYKKEYNSLTFYLQTIAQEVMGDIPTNLSSPEQLSQVLYGFKVKDKELWSRTFNLGTEQRNGVYKKKHPTRMSTASVDKVIEEQTEPLFKKKAEQCHECAGKGQIVKLKVDGSPWKKSPKCKACLGSGIIYVDTGERAGFRLNHPGSFYVTAGGFSSGKDVIQVLKERALAKGKVSSKGQKALDFLESLSKVGSIENYLDSFIKNIKLNTLDGILHTNFNQCVTATGRLSSTAPNFHNLPRASTFPLRKVIKSRFEGGYIVSGDVAQFEFRAAAFLSQCPAAIQFIKDKKDIHMVSAEFYHPTVHSKSKEEIAEIRQACKPETFGPLYGKKNEYANHFYKTFPGIKQWHDRLVQEALDTKEVRSPSGRIYAFPGVARTGADNVKQFTQIVNYPVQGLATGDMTPIMAISLYKKIEEHKLRSIIILTVHDDLTVDVPPEEKDIIVKLFKEVFAELYDDVKKKFDIKLNIPIDFDLSIGYNWLNKNKIDLAA